MATSILFVDGELYLAWTSVVVGAIVVALIALSTVLLRVRTRKWGKRAYGIAPLAWLAVLTTGFLLALANSANSGPPKGLSGNRLGAQIRALPDHAHFSYSGLAFYKGILHVSTNFGLLEVKNGKINKVYQFKERLGGFGAMARPGESVIVADGRTNTRVGELRSSYTAGRTNAVDQKGILFAR